MKKRISIILVITVLLSMLNYVSTSASVLYHMGEIGEKIVVQKANFQTTFSFGWDGKQIKQRYTNTVDDEIDYLLDLFSDKNLVNTGEVFDEYMLYNEERPKVGVFDFSLEGGGNCLVYFDENEVMYIERGYEPDETEKFRMYAKQGMFKYRNEDVYPEIQAFMEEVVNEQKRLEEEKRLEREEAIKKQEEAQGKWFDENAVYITDFKVIYSASFNADDIDFFDVVENNASWGLCSFKRIGENETVVLPFTWAEKLDGFEYYFISESAPSDNKVSLGLEYMIFINKTENYAYYTPTDEVPDCYFEVNVTDDLRVSDISYKAYEDGKLWQTGKIDMSTYKETGTLPKEYFSPDNNIKEEEKEEEKEPEKVETVDVKQYVHDTVMEENISEELKDEQSYSVSWRTYSEDVVYSSNQNDWRAENKKSLIINRVSQIYDFIEKNGTQIDRSAYMKRFREIFPFNNELSDKPAKTYACIKIVGTGVKVFTLTVYDEYVEIEMKNQHTGECQYEYHKVSDANALFEYISDISFMGFAPAKEEIVIDNLDIKNKTINSKPLKVVETYSFKVDVDQNSYKSIYKELAELGEKIECTLTHVMPETGNDSKSYFILEMKGSKATRSFYTAYGSALHYGKCELFFNKNRVYENNQLKNVKSNKPSWTLEFYGVPKDGEVSAVVLRYEFTNPLSTVNRNSSKEFYGNTVCQDFEYKFLLDEYEWNKNKNIPYMIAFDEDEEWMDKKDAYNKRKALGITYDMFRVNALAHVRLDIDDAVAPDWYKELGRNVNLMILSVTSETRFGRTTAPMLRFRGAGGEIWFDYSGINHIDFPNEELHFSWKANVGFDPTRSSEDHTVEGKLAGKILCSGGMDSVVESIELYIGGETYKFGINEFNIIGCDVLTRDLMYRSIADYQKAYWDELDDFMSNMKYGYVYHY